jgi:DeoR/GlpR family transcriptional regulator of sugar metabolism
MEGGDGLRYSSAPARRQRILEAVRGSSFTPAGELSSLLGVSEMTVRRDIRLLAEQGLVRVVHGGVCPVPEAIAVGTDFRVRAAQRRDAKTRIAAAALELIRSGSSIAIDTGTTAMELARLLTPPRRLSVVTPSLPAMVVLAGRPGIEVVGLGGVLHAESQGFAGPATLAALRSLHVSQAFLATTAISRGALWCGNQWDAETKRELVAIADEVVLLADAAKFSATAMAHIVPLSEVDVLVTDGGISPEDLAGVQAAGVRVIVAPADAGSGAASVAAPTQGIAS